MSFPHRGICIGSTAIQPSGLRLKRPDLVSSSPLTHQAGPLVIVATISKAEGKKVFFHEVLLPKGVAGIPFDSKIKVFQLRYVDKKRLSANQIGALPPNLIQDHN